MPTLISKNPATGQDIEQYTLHTDEEVSTFLTNANQQFELWKNTDFTHRANCMHRAADVLENNIEKYAQTMTIEMGKTLSSARAEVEKCAWVCRYYADHAADFLADELIETDASTSKVCYRPLGVILAVMPWNYPMWQVFRFAAPALMAGNAGVLKHASNVPACALQIEEVFHKAGFPDGLFKTMLISSDQVKSVLQNKWVRAATLTGSEYAGSAVASQAGDNIKKTVLELGGSDPYLILEDADLEHAVTQCTKSRLLNAGQSCIGAKRFIVVERVYDEFLEKFTEAMSAAIMGDPMQEVDLGPLARMDLRNEVHQQVVDSVAAGANLHLGGTIPDSAGAYYPPTILTDIPKGSPAYEDEIFGPVASVFKVKDEDEAIALANSTRFGLGACVFTKDLERGERIATNELEAGCCFVNHFVKSDPRLPFGGIKQSGYGRELGYHGIREFVNIKTVWIL